MNCMECVDPPFGKAKFKDPRIPPIDVGICLCKECFECYADERIEELQRGIDDLEKEKAG